MGTDAGTWAKAALVGVLGLLLAVSPLPADETPVRAAAAPPNVVLIVTDDQRWDTLWALPKIQTELVNHSVSFSNAFTVNPWCCPSRASILTGQPSHTNGVWRNKAPYGGFLSFKDGSTLATWLQAAGYHTGFIGKYLNGYEGNTYIPPGWSRWVAFKSGTYKFYNYTLNVDGVSKSYGTGAQNYSTDVLSSYATSFIRNAPSNQPLFLYFTPNAPHGVPRAGDLYGDPPKVAPRHRTTFADLAPWRPPSYNETDVSDKPAHIQALTSIERDLFRTKQYKSLLAVDDAVKAILTALSDEGRLANTMFIFTSDNGILWGEHRWHEKRVPYEESVRIPLLVRYDPLTAIPRNDSRLVTTIDLAPTIAEAAGTGAPRAEGLSLMPVLAGTDPPWRNDFLVEHLQQKGDPIVTYCALRNYTHMYSVYQTGERELYDLAQDPYQLTNVAADPTQTMTVAGLDSRLRELCDPPPPGFAFPAPSPTP